MPRKPTPGGRDEGRAQFRGETVERRLLLSASWITGTAGDDTLFGTAGDDSIQGMGGNDIVYAGAGDDLIRAAYGDDVLWGGSGFDTVDYSYASSAVTVDLTDSGAQDTGGGGVDELHEIEAVVGSDYGDTFAFANPADGAVYSVDGGLGTDVVDLSAWHLSDVTFGDGTVHVDTGTGAFTVDFANVDAIVLGDQLVSVLGGAGDLAVSGHDGSSVWLSHGQLFEVDQIGNGDVDFSYDGASNTLTVSGFNGTNGGSVLSIQDLNGGGLAVGSVTVDRTAGTLISDADIHTITMVGGSHFDLVEVGGGAGSIDAFVGDDWNSDIVINADVGSISAANLFGGGGDNITVHGDVGSVSVTGQIAATFEVFGDLDVLSAADINQAVTVHGDMASFAVAGDVTNTVTVDGKLGSLSADRVTNDVLVHGDLDSFTVSRQMAGQLTADRVVGTLDLYGPGGFEAHPTYATMTQVVWGGGSPLDTAVPNSAPLASSATTGVIAGTSGTLLPTGTDPDAFDTIQAIRIDSLPGDGVLRFGGAPVSVNDVLTGDQIESGLLTFDAGGAAVGTVSFDFSVSDGALWSASAATLTVDVLPAVSDLAPVADAGVDQVVNEGDLVTLDAGGSTDPEGKALTYSWAQVSGPAVVLSDVTAAQPTFVAPQGLSNDTALFQLTVSDGMTETIDTVAVAINADNDAPTADAGINQIAAEGDLVTLDASGSADPEGQRLTYSWVQQSGPAVTLSNANTATPTFVAPQVAGDATATFAVTVSDGTTRSVATVDVAIRGIDDAPVAVAGPGQTVAESAVVTLDGSRSSDPEGQRLSYSWRQVGGPPVRLSDPTAVRPTFSAPELLGEGSVSFELTVSDGTSASVDSVAVTILGDNDPPAVSTGAAQYADVGELVTLFAAARDAEGQPLSYSWTQLSGPTVSLTGAQSASPTFSAPAVTETASLVFRVTVSDGTNVSVATAMITILGEQAEPTAPKTESATYETPQPAVTSAPSRQEPITGGGTTDSTTAALRHELARALAVGGAVADTEALPELAAPATTELPRENAADADQVAPESSLVRVSVLADDDQLTAASQHVIVGDAGGSVQLRPTLPDRPAGEVSFVWTQIAGTEVKLSRADTESPTAQLPEVFVEEELVFQVAMRSGGDEVTEQVTVRVQPVDSTQRESLALSASHDEAAGLVAAAGPHEAHGIGRIWAALLVLIRTRAPRGSA